MKGIKFKQIISFLFIISALLAIMFFAAPYNYLILGAIFVLVAVFAFFHRPNWLLSIAIILAIFGQQIVIQINQYWYYDMSFAEPILLAALLIILIRAKKFGLSLDWIMGLLIVYLLASMVTIGKVTDFHIFIYEVKVVLFSLLAYFASRNIFNRFRFEALFLASAVAIIIISSSVLSIFVSSGFSRELLNDRSAIRSSFGAIALIGAILSLLLPIVVARLMMGIKKVFELVYPLSIAVGLAAIFLILSKAAILSFTIAMVYLFIRNRKKRIAMLLTVLMLFVCAITFVPEFYQGFVKRVENTAKDNNTEYRLSEYEISWRLIKRHPMTGVGVGQQPKYFRGEYGDDFNNLLNNYFLQTTVDLGAIGLSIASLITLIFLIKILRAENNQLNQAFIAMFIAAVVNSQFEVTMFAFNYIIIFWIIAGAATRSFESHENFGYHN